jgi:WD40 repeat protein
LLATGGADTTVRTWQIDSAGASRGSEALRGHTGNVDALAWSPSDANALASGASDRSVRLWDTRSSKASGSVPIKGVPLSMGWRSDGLLAVGTKEDAMHLIDTRKGAVVHTHQFPQELNEFAFTPSGLCYCAMGIRGVAVDEGLVGVFAIPSLPSTTAAAGTTATAATAVPSTAGSGSGAPSSAPSLAASAVSGPSTAASTSSTTASSPPLSVDELARVRGHTSSIVVLRFDPTYKHFATGAGDSIVCIWDAAEVACVRTIDRAESQIRGLSFSHNGAHLAIASGDRDDATKTLEVVRVADGTRIKSFTAKNGVNFLGWSPHGNILAYAMDDGKAVVPPPDIGHVRIVAV